MQEEILHYFHHFVNVVLTLYYILHPH